MDNNKKCLTVKELIDELSKLAPYAGVYAMENKDAYAYVDNLGHVHRAVTKADYFTELDGSFWVTV